MPHIDTTSDTTNSPPSYFETYPRKKSDRTSSLAGSVASTSSGVMFPTKITEGSSQHAKAKAHTSQAHTSLARTRQPSPDRDPPSEYRTPALRYSGSSATTHYLETPPRTPPSVFDINVVSAPVPDVGTMDALVDGMNCFDRDDILYASSLHRLEQFTGTNSPRDPFKFHGNSPTPQRSNLLKDAALIRTSSAQTFKRSRIPRPKLKNTIASKPFNHFVLHRVKAEIPSINDIVRAHALDFTPSASLDSRDSIDMVSRSSVDTIAEEVQHTLRQPIPDTTPTKVTIIKQAPMVFPSLDKRNSHLSDEYKDSESSTKSRTEAIATYIRSTRLTTLVKIPRPLKMPLQVSLSDLGDPDGHPLVIFLGLGAVRYIMGLYDEMSEVLGLRIITIDR